MRSAVSRIAVEKRKWGSGEELVKEECGKSKRKEKKKKREKREMEQLTKNKGSEREEAGSERSNL